MLRHFLTVAVRHLARQKRLTIINVFGLSLGLACCMLFVLYAVNEFNYDDFHRDAKNVYRVIEWSQGLPDRQPSGNAGLSIPMGPALQKDFADVTRMVRFRGGREALVRVGENITRMPVSYADPSYFSVFSFPFLAGDPAHALEGPNGVVVTRSTALRLFGSDDVAGRTLWVKTDSSFVPFAIAGVVRDLPPNTIFDWGILGSYRYAEAHSDPGMRTDWYSTYGDETFVELRQGSSLARDVRRLVGFRAAHLPGEQADLIKNHEWDGKGVPPITFRLQSLQSIHTDPRIDGSGNPVDPSHIWLLVALASGVLLIACINFTILSIGRSAGRATEVGVRKVIGSGRKALFWQFLMESLVLSFLSMGIGLLMAFLLLPWFNGLAGVNVHFDFGRFPELAWMLLGLAVATGLLAGAYPALVLSGIRPLQVFKRAVRLKGSNAFTRSLIVTQFALSVGLVAATILILRQVSFMRTRDLGFRKGNVIDVEAAGVDTRRIYPLFRNAAVAPPGVLGVTSAQIGLGEGNGYMGGGCHCRGKDGFALEYPVEPGYLSVLGMHLLAGRGFDARVSTDSVSAAVANEALLKEFNIPLDSAVGQTLVIGPQSLFIIGVVRNFNFSSLHDAVQPQLFFWPSDLSPNHFYVRVAPGDPGPVLHSLAHTWKGLVPGLAFRYEFLDEEMNRFYASETRWTRILGWAGGIAICLACMGLFGMAALVAVNRTREVGIRKVLGASVVAIVRLMVREFALLVVVSVLVATPVTWYFVQRWLNGYAFREDVSGWIFGLVGMGAIVVALVTVGFHAVRAATENPVRSLRTE